MTTEFKVKSSKGDVSYKVVITEDDETGELVKATCQCRDYIHRRKNTGGFCKHINYVYFDE